MEQKLSQLIRLTCWYQLINFNKSGTKSIFFALKQKIRVLGNVVWWKKKNVKVAYLVCLLDESISGESMTMKTIDKISLKWQFLYRNKKYIKSELKTLLCNTIIQ